MSKLNPSESKILRQGGKILGRILKRLLYLAAQKKTGDEIEAEAEKLIKDAGGFPAFKEAKNAKGEFYPAAICLSLNEEVVHGLPFGKKIYAGDLVSIDIGLRYKGLVTDMAWTIYVEGKDKKVKRMLKFNQLALKRAIQKARLPYFVEDISLEIERTAQEAGVVPVADLTGHGVGHSLHEPPAVFNIFPGKRKIVLEENKALAIEPIFALKEYKGLHTKGGWGIIAPKGVLTSHFEATVIVGKKPEIITPLP
ncbi:M24 family metallopeptidase [bacterium]|nr:M24 family metallopeptidase [bacterium]